MTYAIIKTGGRQYRVVEGDTIDVDLVDVETGKTATLTSGKVFAPGSRYSCVAVRRVTFRRAKRLQTRNQQDNLAFRRPRVVVGM